MAETLIDVRHLPKRAAYEQLGAHAGAVLEGIHDPIAAMATLSCLIHHGFGHLWTGFYRVVEPNKLLRVGPYQGSLGCLEIRVGQGVCGVAADRKQTVIVPDVSKFPGHITCDSRSQSEIVVPVFDSDRALIAVLDVDSERLAAFDREDAEGLEQIVSWFSAQSSLPFSPM